MNGLEALLVLLFLGILLVAAWLVEPQLTHHAPGRLAQIATWVFLTALWLAGGSAIVFVVSYLLLFWLGKTAATIGLVIGVTTLIVMPFVWWRGVRAIGNHLEHPGRPQLKR
jgi:hypothetical protein